MSGTPITSTEKKRRFFLFAGGSFLAILCILLASFFLLAPSKPPSTTSLGVAKRESVKGQAGGQGSEEYNKKLEQHDSQRADSALSAGDSFIPTPIGKPSLVTKKVDTPPPPAPVVATPRVAPVKTPRVDNTMLKRMMEDLAQLDAKLSNASVGQGKIVYLCDFEKAKNKETREGVAPGNSAPTLSPLDLNPGDLLYAVVDTGVNSDVPSAVMATIVQGKHKKSRLLGKFQRFEERLVLAFTRIIPPSGEGRDIQIEAYAVDPETTESSVASSVDTHFFSRWGGLIASAFLEGLADAKKFSGAQSTVYGGYNGTTDQMVWNNYSLEDQMWIAAGKVGEKSSKIFEKNFDRPPTVYLEAGSPIGVLVLNVKPKQR